MAATRNAILALCSLTVAGCLSVSRTDRLPACSRVDPDLVPDGLGSAYDGIAGVAVVPPDSVRALRGPFLRTEGLGGDKVTLREDGTAVSIPFSDVPPLFRRYRDEGTWEAEGSQVVIQMREYQERAACVGVERHDAIRVDGRVWLVRSLLRPGFRSWFARYRDGFANGYAVDGYEEGGKGQFVPDYDIHVEQDAD